MKAIILTTKDDFLNLLIKIEKKLDYKLYTMIFLSIMAIILLATITISGLYLYQITKIDAYIAIFLIGGLGLLFSIPGLGMALSSLIELINKSKKIIHDLQLKCLHEYDVKEEKIFIDKSLQVLSEHLDVNINLSGILLKKSTSETNTPTIYTYR